MTEADWCACGEPEPMLKYLFGPATVCNEHGMEWNVYREKRTSDRKLRLFAVACCFRIWQLITNEWCRRAIVVGEQYADGEAEAWEFDYTHEEIEPVRHRYTKDSNRAACWALEPDCRGLANGRAGGTGRA